MLSCKWGSRKSNKPLYSEESPKVPFGVSASSSPPFPCQATWVLFWNWSIACSSQHRVFAAPPLFPGYLSAQSLIPLGSLPRLCQTPVSDAPIDSPSSSSMAFLTFGISFLLGWFFAGYPFSQLPKGRELVYVVHHGFPKPGALPGIDYVLFVCWIHDDLLLATSLRVSLWWRSEDACPAWGWREGGAYTFTGRASAPRSIRTRRQLQAWQTSCVCY